MCDDGYKGDGFVCMIESNCNNIPQLCDINAHCAQNFGKHQCVCNQGMKYKALNFQVPFEKSLKLPQDISEMDLSVLSHRSTRLDF